MTPVSYEEFIERVNKYHTQFKDSWRYGQTYFNVLSNVRPMIAEQLRATLHDPFFKDKVSEETHLFVRSIWE